ncbi:efflux RND transporter periplasmic adaptor subunit [Eilatimonas milleporae]|uniref:RND family efflux transporter MFP subunit n=1 Tax=Eilatimonas milleporae TaxID=911205 RepID=A0A3M0CU76_9PROT|nr:efflux RND transporter periplasmic adaptor subunit [Eilatimonas milleporae]RMB12030.1 RND family efflux transporter MFP subunit [Eilatimonas milleporae]
MPSHTPPTGTGLANRDLTEYVLGRVRLTGSGALRLVLAVAGVGVILAILALRLSAQSGQDIPKGFDPIGASRALPVRTVTVELAPGYYARRSFTGRAIAARTSPMSFELAGTLARVHVDQGDRVKGGDLLAELDTARLHARLAEVRAERDEAAANLALAERTLNRVRETHARGHASAQRLDEAEANATALKARLGRLAATIGALDVDLEKSRIRAPFDGTITARMADEGTVTAAGSAILELIEDGVMEAQIGLPPDIAAAVRSGMPIALYNGRRKPIETATLKAIVPVITGETRTMMATFDLPGSGITRGELVTAIVRNWHEAGGAWIPLRSLSADVRGLWRVYKVTDGPDGPHVRFENVQILHTDGDRVFVTGTLSGGDRIIADGIDRLAPGQRVTILDDSPASIG